MAEICEWKSGDDGDALDQCEHCQADGESTANWACREQGFFGSIKQLLCCARCGDYMRVGPHQKMHTFNTFKPNMHFLCDDCFDQLPE